MSAVKLSVFVCGVRLSQRGRWSSCGTPTRILSAAHNQCSYHRLDGLAFRHNHNQYNMTCSLHSYYTTSGFISPYRRRHAAPSSAMLDSTFRAIVLSLPEHVRILVVGALNTRLPGINRRD